METTVFSLLILSSIFLLAISSVVSAQSVSNLFVTLGLIIYCLLVGSRGDSGSDTFLYKLFYEGGIEYPVFSEPGLGYIFDAFNLVKIPFNGLIYAQAALCFCSLFIIRITSGSSAVIFYILFFGLNIDFSTLRQSIALHLLVICVYRVNGILPALMMTGIHFGAIFTLINRISLKTSLFFIPPILLVASFFIQRYIELVGEFFIRSNYDWLLQTMIIILYMAIKNYGRINILSVALLSYFPIGYRLIAYVIPFQRPGHVNGRYDVIAAMVLFLVSPVKINSYGEQSVQNDGDKSVIIHFQNLLK